MKKFLDPTPIASTLIPSSLQNTKLQSKPKTNKMLVSIETKAFKSNKPLQSSKFCGDKNKIFSLEENNDIEEDSECLTQSTLAIDRDKEKNITCDQMSKEFISDITLTLEYEQDTTSTPTSQNSIDEVYSQNTKAKFEFSFPQVNNQNQAKRLKTSI